MSGVSSAGPNRLNWPGASSRETVPEARSVEEAQSTNRNVAAPVANPDQAQAATAAGATETVQETKKEQKPFQNVLRPMSDEDIIDQLLKLQKPPTPENREVLMAMVQHGIEASEENFNAINRLRKGKTNSSSLESAIVALSKGLTDSTKGVDALAKFLSKNPQLAQQLEQLNISMAQFRNALQSNRNIFSDGLFSGLMAILSDFDDQYKKLSKKSKDNELNLPKVKRQELMSDLNSLNQLLGGLSKQVVDEGPAAQYLKGSLEQLRGNLEEILDNLTSQVIFSKDPKKEHSGYSENYAYWQLPNPMTQRASNIDVLAKKSNDYSDKIDENRTRLVVKLETPDLGNMGIIADVRDKDVYSVFQSDNLETASTVEKNVKTFEQQLDEQEFNLKGFQSVKRRTNLKKHLMPTVELNSMSRIQTEV